MSKCSNCQKNLSCGCQRRTATDGKSVCSNCVTTYEANLKQKQSIIAVPQTNQVWGKDRYKIAK